MAVRDSNTNTAIDQVNVDISIVNRRNIFAAIAKVGRFLSLSWIKTNRNPSQESIEKAKERHMAKYNNVSSYANSYNRPY